MTPCNSPEIILNTLKEWQLEMNSPRNDRRVQTGYKEKLLKVQEFFKPPRKHLDSALGSIQNESLKSFEDEYNIWDWHRGQG